MAGYNEKQQQHRQKHDDADDEQQQQQQHEAGDASRGWPLETKVSNRLSAYNRLSALLNLIVAGSWYEAMKQIEGFLLDTDPTAAEFVPRRNRNKQQQQQQQQDINTHNT